MIQNATNTVLKSLSADQRQQLGLPDQVDVDGKMGPQAFNTFRALSNGGYGAKLRSALADLRHHSVWGDEPDRVEHFR
jgi:hypothetical protein